MGRGGRGSGGRDPLTIYRSIFHPTPLLLNSPHNTPVIGEGNKKTKQYEKHHLRIIRLIIRKKKSLC